MDGVKPYPIEGDNGANFTAGSGPSLSYSFYTFHALKTMKSFIGVAFNSNGNDRPMKFAVQIDSESPKEVSYIPPTAVGTMPAAQGGNDGWAANNVIQVTTNHSDIGPGAHTLKLWMIEPAVVLEKFVIDTGGLLSSYLGPPESLKV